MSELRAKDVMEPQVISVNKDDSLKTVSDILKKNNISGAPVLDASGELVGVISQSDLLHFIAFDDYMSRVKNSYYAGESSWNTNFLVDVSEELRSSTASEIMSERVITVNLEDRISDIAVTMRRNNVHRVLVLDDSKIAGIITALELLKILEQH